MTSADQTQQHSFLVIDCGSTKTTAVLFDVVAGVHRFIACASAPTTAAAPWSNVLLGVQQAIGRISEAIGRPLLTSRGTLIKPSRQDGSGVDKFAAVVSAAPPLQTLLVGLSDEVSLASARRALSSVYTQEIDHICLTDHRSEPAQIATVIEKKPDLIFVTGGIDGGADRRLLKLLETVSVGVDVLSLIKRPHVVYAGNTNLRERARELFSQHTAVQIADNVRPSLEVEQPGDAARIVGELYEDVKVNALPGIRDISEWSNYPLQATFRAFAKVCEYFAALQKGRVLGLDLGSNQVTLVMAEPDQAQVMIRSDLGMGRPIANLLASVRPETIIDWIPAEVTVADVQTFIYNKSLYPQTVPLTETELFLEQAVARQIIHCVAADAIDQWGWSKQGQFPPFKVLLVRGSALINTPRPEQFIFTVLNALQPAGIFSIALDHYGALPALGTLATHEPLAVVQALEGGVLVDVGWVVAPTGKGQAGQKVLHVTFQSGDARQYEVEVSYGSIEVLPLIPGQAAQITLQPTRRFDIGFGPGQGKQITVRGGIVGLVIDARGRPLDLSRDVAARRAQIRQWLWDMGG